MRASVKAPFAKPPLLHGLRVAVRASVKAPFAKPLAASSPPSAAAAAAAARPTCSHFDVRARTAKLERCYLLALKVRAAMGAGAALQDALQRLRAAVPSSYLTPEPEVATRAGASFH